MFTKLKQFATNDDATVAIEYALIAIIVSIAIYNSVATIAPILNSMLAKVSAGLATAIAK